MIQQLWNAAAFAILTISSVGFSDEKTELKKNNAVLTSSDWYLRGKTQYEYVPHHIASAVPGELRQVSILLINRSDGAIELESAKPSCVCIKASVPQIKLEPGDAIPLTFLIETSNRPTSTTGHYGITIATRGELQEIRIQISAKFDNFIAFRQKEHVFEFVRDNAESTFDLPLVFSSEQVLGECKVSLTDELRVAKASIVKNGSKAFVQLRVSEGQIKDEFAAGQVKILRGGSEVSSVTCLLQSRSQLQVVPELVRFPATLDADGVAETTVIVIDRSNESRSELSLVNCTSDGGLEVRAEMIPLNKGRYRVRLLKPNDPMFPQKGDLMLRLLKEGNAVELPLEYQLP